MARKAKAQKKSEQTSASVVRDLLHAQWPAIAVFAFIYVVYWICYPYPYITADSGEYVNSALRLANNPYRPLGYSIFLAICHFFSSSARAVPFFQALVYLLGLLYFMHQLNRTIALPQQAYRLLGVLLALNPLPFFYTRHLLSDSIFATLTLCFAGSLLRYFKTPGWGHLLHLILWGGLSLFVRHIGLLYLAFAGAVILIKLRKQAALHLAMLAASSLLIIAGICYKMRQDLGVFKMNTLDGWVLWAIAVPYVDLTPEYRNSVKSQRLQAIYEYLASFPPEIYREQNGEWHKWNNDSPAKRLVFAYIQQHRLAYYAAWIRTNDDLKTVSQDILMHHVPQYITGYFLPSVLRGFWPNMALNEGGWNDYPRYSKRPQPDQVIQAYYNEDSSTWHARFEIFPLLKPLIDAWVKLLGPLLLVVLIACLIFRKELRGAREAEVSLLLLAWVLFYYVGVGAMSIIFARYVMPITPFTLTLSFVGALKIYQLKFQKLAREAH